MKRSKNIIIFSGYHLPHLGGIERYTDNLSLELKKDGWNVTIVSSNYDNFENKEIIHDTLNYRIPIYNIFKSRYPIPKKNKSFKGIISELDKYEYDAVIVNTRFHLTSLIGAKYAKKRGIPVFLIEHGSEHLTIDNKVLDFMGAIYEHVLTMYIKKYVNYYYGVSQSACDWQGHFKIKSDGVWHNGISAFYDTSKIKRDNKKIIISYAGRILRQKGVYELLEAFSKLESKYNNIELLIAGDGNQLEVLKNMYGNDKHIKFLGKLDFEGMKKLYEKTHIFVYAPLWPEGLPTSVLEAGYMKCACIVSPFGGTKEIIDDGTNGIYVENENELESALDSLISNASLREKYSKNIHKKVTDNFLWSVIAKKIEKDILNKIKTGE